MKLSIIVPVYNEEKTVAKVLEKVVKLKIPNHTKEVIVIDDGSTDSTQLKIKDLRLKNKNFIFIEHKLNQGKIAIRQRIYLSV